MPKVLMIARKRFRFGGAVVDRNEEFFADAKKAKVLKALGRARPAPKPIVEEDLAPLNEPLNNDKAELREEYMRVVGKRPFNGWDVDELKKRIAGYERRDMRAAK